MYHTYAKLSKLHYTTLYNAEVAMQPKHTPPVALFKEKYFI